MLVQMVLILVAMIVLMLHGQMNVIVSVIFADQQDCSCDHEREREDCQNARKFPEEQER